MYYWSRNYNELPKGVYFAEIRDHPWFGFYLFRAWSISGNTYLEAISEDLQELIKIADRFAAGDTDPRIYSVSR